MSENNQTSEGKHWSCNICPYAIVTLCDKNTHLKSMKDAYFLSKRALTVVEMGTKKIPKHLNKHERKKACIIYSKITYLDKGIVLYVHFIIVGLNASINILNLNLIIVEKSYRWSSEIKTKRIKIWINNRILQKWMVLWILWQSWLLMSRPSTTYEIRKTVQSSF